MAFVIKQDNEDVVLFYVRDKDGNVNIIEQYIERGNQSSLRYHINNIYKKNIGAPTKTFMENIINRSKTAETEQRKKR